MSNNLISVKNKNSPMCLYLYFAISMGRSIGVCFHRERPCNIMFEHDHLLETLTRKAGLTVCTVT